MAVAWLYFESNPTGWCILLLISHLPTDRGGDAAKDKSREHTRLAATRTPDSMARTFYRWIIEQSNNVWSQIPFGLESTIWRWPCENVYSSLSLMVCKITHIWRSHFSKILLGRQNRNHFWCFNSGSMKGRRFLPLISTWVHLLQDMTRWFTRDVWAPEQLVCYDNDGDRKDWIAEETKMVNFRLPSVERLNELTNGSDADGRNIIADWKLETAIWLTKVAILEAQGPSHARLFSLWKLCGLEAVKGV